MSNTTQIHATAALLTMCVLWISGFLKVGMIVRSAKEDQSSVGSPTKKFKPGGVKRLMILFLGQSIPESYQNVKKILLDLELDKLSFTLACDLKLLNISKYKDSFCS